ncbi:hypothetical protein SK128_003068 [Halocaridina rubra]|uniref:Carbohydrate sulfotransferase n=1 Tax=Halocaridina rubra TaxID=373956 RepID=A0AAN8WBG6_HALRR
MGRVTPLLCERFHIIPDVSFQLACHVASHARRATLRYGIFRMDNHWRPQYSLCKPCALPYEYVLKMESLNEDLQFLVQKLNMTEVDTKIHKNASEKKKDSNYEDYFKDIPNTIIKEIYRLYLHDFLYFGYDIPGFLTAHMNE